MTYNFDEIIDRRHTNALNTDGFWSCFVHAAEYAGNAPAHCLRDQRRTSEKPPVGRLFPAYSPAAGGETIPTLARWSGQCKRKMRLCNYFSAIPHFDGEIRRNIDESNH